MASKGELRILSYNVAGLPVFWQGRSPWIDSGLISAHFGEGHYDVVGLQEDWSAHRQLAGKLGSALPYRTVHMGSVPFGDGLSIFSKYPVYNQNSVTWEKLCGVFSNDSDELAPKGFVHTVLCLTKDPKGPKADFFTLHADAGNDPGSIAARDDNFRQLAAYINEYCAGRALILTGDFNDYYERLTGGGTHLTELVPGLRDGWRERTSQGLYVGVDVGVHETPENRDSIDRVMVRDGGGLRFTFLELTNFNIQLVDGKPVSAERWLAEGSARLGLSDHAARYAKLGWEYDAAQAFNYGELKPPTWSFGWLGRQICSFGHVAGIVLSEPFKLLWKRMNSKSKNKPSKGAQHGDH